MADWLHPPLLLLLCALCGAAGAVLGLGGGLLVVPLLVFAWGLEFHQAAATSLVCCLATSAAGSLGLERSGRVDYALVAELEVFAVAGALGAAALAVRIPAAVLAFLFALVSLVAAWRVARRELRVGDAGAPGGESAPTAPGPARRAGAWALSAVAGVASTLLGIGGGPIKVPLQTELLRVNLPTALANSNLMVGITSAIGVAASYGRGLIRPEETAAACLGIAAGAYAGGRVAHHLKTRWLAIAFVLVLVVTALRMLWKVKESWSGA